MARRPRGAPRRAPNREQPDYRLLDFLLRLKAVEPDPNGDAVWLLLGQPRLTDEGETIH